jgi:hypothetical protein
MREREHGVPEGGLERDLPGRDLAPILIHEEEEAVVVGRGGIDRRVAERDANREDSIGSLGLRLDVLAAPGKEGEIRP